MHIFLTSVIWLLCTWTLLAEVRLNLTRETTLSDVFDAGVRPVVIPGLNRCSAMNLKITISVEGHDVTIDAMFVTFVVYENDLLADIWVKSQYMELEEGLEMMRLFMSKLDWDKESRSEREQKLKEFEAAKKEHPLASVNFGVRSSGNPSLNAYFLKGISDKPLRFSLKASIGHERSKRVIRRTPLESPPGYEDWDMYSRDSMVVNNEPRPPLKVGGTGRRVVTEEASDPRYKNWMIWILIAIIIGVLWKWRNSKNIRSQP